MDHVRPSVICTPRNLAPLTDSTALPLMVREGVWFVFLPEVHSFLFSFLDFELKIIDVTPVDKFKRLLSVG